MTYFLPGVTRHRLSNGLLVTYHAQKHELRLLYTDQLLPFFLINDSTLVVINRTGRKSASPETVTCTPSIIRKDFVID